MKFEEVKAKVVDNCQKAFDRVRGNPKVEALWQKVAQSSRRTKMIVGGVAIVLIAALVMSSCGGDKNTLVCEGCKAQFKIERGKFSVAIIYPKEITWSIRQKSTSFLGGDDYETVWHSKTHEEASVGEQFQCPYCKRFMLVK